MDRSSTSKCLPRRPPPPLAPRSSAPVARASLLATRRVLQQIVHVLRHVEIRLLRVFLIAKDVRVDVQDVLFGSLPCRRAPPRQSQHRPRGGERIRPAKRRIVQRLLNLHRGAVLSPRRPQEFRLLHRERHAWRGSSGAPSRVRAREGVAADDRLERRSRLEQRELRGAVVSARATEFRLRQPGIRRGVTRAERGVGGAAKREDGLARRQRRGREFQSPFPI